MGNVTCLARLHNTSSHLGVLNRLKKSKAISLLLIATLACSISVPLSSETAVSASGPGGVYGGLKLWLDASDVEADGGAEPNMTNGDEFSEGDCWVSKDPSHLEACPVLDSPTYETNISSSFFNHHAAFRFTRFDDENGNVLKVEGLDIRAATMEDSTILAVYRPETLDAEDACENHGVWGNDNTDWDRFFLAHYCDYSIGLLDGVVSLGQASAFQRVEGAADESKVQVFTVAYDGEAGGDLNIGPTNGSTVYINGIVSTRFTDTTDPNLANADFYVGSDGDNSVFRGEIAEIIVYDRILSNSELNQVNEYLSDKYLVTIQRLPIHRERLVAPTLAIDKIGAHFVELSWSTPDGSPTSQEVLLDGKFAKTVPLGTQKLRIEGLAKNSRHQIALQVNYNSGHLETETKSFRTRNIKKLVVRFEGNSSILRPLAIERIHNWVRALPKDTQEPRWKINSFVKKLPSNLVRGNLSLARARAQALLLKVRNWVEINAPRLLPQREPLSWSPKARKAVIRFSYLPEQPS